MAYFSYHAKAKRLIKSGNLLNYLFCNRWNKISPALVLFFKNDKPMPIRQVHFDEYLSLIDKCSIFTDNYPMNIKIDTIWGTYLQTNNYVVGDDNSCVLIDASASLEKIKAIVGKRNLLAVLLTHGHWDHFEKLDSIIKHYNVKCYLDKNALAKMQTPTSFHGNKPIKTTLSKSNFIFVNDGEKIKFDSIEVSVISSRGHTDCGLCFLLENNLFCGDTLFYHTYGRTDLPSGNDEEMENSIKKLLSLPQNTFIFPGHGHPSTIEEERKTYGL